MMGGQISLSSVLFYSSDWGTQRSPCVHFYFSVHFIKYYIGNFKAYSCLKGRVWAKVLQGCVPRSFMCVVAKHVSAKE